MRFLDPSKSVYSKMGKKFTLQQNGENKILLLFNQNRLSFNLRSFFPFNQENNVRNN